MFTFCSSYLSSFGGMLKKRLRQKDLAAKNGTSKRVIVCRTTDEVNADLARSWCDDHGLECQLADQRDGLFPTEACAIAIDLNDCVLGPKDRSQLVEWLCKTLLPYPIAVASYDLSPEVKNALRTRGMLVFRRIERRLFYELAAAIEFDRAEFAV
jgi:hypothetical protein